MLRNRTDFFQNFQFLGRFFRKFLGKRGILPKKSKISENFPEISSRFRLPIGAVAWKKPFNCWLTTAAGRASGLGAAKALGSIPWRALSQGLPRKELACNCCRALLDLGCDQGPQRPVARSARRAASKIAGRAPPEAGCQQSVGARRRSRQGQPTRAPPRENRA